MGNSVMHKFVTFFCRCGQVTQVLSARTFNDVYVHIPAHNIVLRAHVAVLSILSALHRVSVGAILAGLPFSYVAKYYDWRGAFLALEVLLIGVLVLKILTRNVQYKMVLVRKKLE